VEFFLNVPLFFLSVIMLTFFVPPMGRDAALGDLIHFLGPDLHLIDVAVARDDRGVKRLVEVRLRHGNVILKTARNRLIGRVNDTEHFVAVHLGFGNDTDG